MLGWIHAIEINGHEQCADLVVGYVAAGDAGDEEFNLFTRETQAVSLFSYDVLWSQAASLVLSISTAA